MVVVYHRLHCYNYYTFLLSGLIPSFLIISFCYDSAVNVKLVTSIRLGSRVARIVRPFPIIYSVPISKICPGVLIPDPAVLQVLGKSV
ncbi:hypothetical protein L873DRAFT_1216322 [Choiromyces venosus 120613-1]|uniref:Uncharacterized protein n=1 Tax=Choiromyces venosus 120613-1 TaxID=1336337 RepID=A0A3N4JE56_9PEZI|nr:hypothetical protein L873DRAFT_1216322 [Choiromyces venosus 120613-1]